MAAERVRLTPTRSLLGLPRPVVRAPAGTGSAYAGTESPCACVDQVRMSAAIREEVGAFLAMLVNLCT